MESEPKIQEKQVVKRDMMSFLQIQKDINDLVIKIKKSNHN